MGFQILALCLLLCCDYSQAQGRKPAVEDFVGVEVEEAEITPQGTESLYNLQQDISKIEAEQKTRKSKATKVQSPDAPLSPAVIAGIIFCLGLPLIILFFMMARMKKKASLESASNIEILEKYRKDKERKSEESAKKAS
jgi:hypothetical protein